MSEAISVDEMMFASGESFEYVRCNQCRTVQIAEIPKDLARYYRSENYYSFQAQQRGPLFKAMLKRAAARGMVGQPAKYPRTNGLMDRIRRGAEPWIATVEGLTLNASILDVGCGGGTRLDALASIGFLNLTGIDAFLPPEREVSGAAGVRLFREEIEDHEGQYDLIMMHHSLEHGIDPLAMLEAARKRLNQGGAIFVRIPLLQDEIWQKYGRYWAQLDAPRHLYLWPHDAFIGLARRAGLICIGHGTDTLGWSLAWSEAYSRGIPMHNENGTANSLPFDKAQLAEFDRKARELNAVGKGDQGYFVLKSA